MSDNLSPSKTSPRSNGDSGRSFWFFILFMATLGAFSSLVNDMYLPTLPAMMREFHTTPSFTQLGLTSVMAGLGIGSVFLGSLSDHTGRKPVLIGALILFCTATAISLFSTSICFFIVARFFQGIGAAGPMVLSTSIPADDYSGRKLALVMALMGAVNGIAPAAGPLIGGFMADSLGWRGIFAILILIGLIMIFFTCRSKESLPPQRRMPLDSMSSFWNKYKQLLSNGRFMLYVITKAVGIAILFAYISSGPFILQDIFGFSSLSFGLIFGANALVSAIGSTAAMKFRVLKNGLTTGGIGVFFFAGFAAFVLFFKPNIYLYELSVVPMLFFAGMIFSSANSLAMEVGRQEAGTASAILSFVKYLLAAIVSPLVGLGDIPHSTSIAFVALAVPALALALAIIKLKPLADMVK